MYTNAMDLLQKFTDHTRCCGVCQFVTTMEYGQNIFCNRSEFSAPTGSSIALHQLADRTKIVKNVG